MTTTTQQQPGGRLRHLQLNLKILESGGLVVSTPQAQDRADVVRGPDQLWWAVHQAIVRARFAGHQQWRRSAEPETKTTAAEPRLREGVSWSKSAAARPDVTDTAAWTPLPDGSWLSPGGKRYRSQRMIAGIVARRARFGLPTSYEAAVAAAVEHDQADQSGGSEVERLFDRIASVTDDVRWHTKDRRNSALAGQQAAS